VYGDALQNHLVAVVVPVSEAIEAWAKEAGVQYSNVKELLKKDASH